MMLKSELWFRKGNESYFLTDKASVSATDVEIVFLRTYLDRVVFAYAFLLFQICDYISQDILYR